MPTIHELHKQRDLKYFDLAILKMELSEFIKSPCETVPIDDLKNQYSFTLREINKIDDSIKIIILTQIEWAKRDLKNLETQLSLVPSPFDVKELLSYSEIFK
jgi:hypothetical protein